MKMKQYQGQLFVFEILVNLLHSNIIGVLDLVTGKSTGFLVQFMKPDCDDFCFLIWCIKYAVIRKCVNCGHEGMRILSSNSQTVCAFQARIDWYYRSQRLPKNIPCMLTPPPPAWSADTRHAGSMDSCC